MKPNDKKLHFQKTVGDHIKHLRLKKKMSHDDLSDASGVSRQAISKIEAGRRTPSSYTLMKLSEGLGVKFDVLVRGIRDHL